TSRPPASIPAAASSCGASSRTSWPRARPCCSPRSTSRRPTGWPTRSPSSTTAGLKANLGATVIEIGMPGEGSALMALQALARLGVQPPVLEGTTVHLTVADSSSLLAVLRALDAEGIAPTGVTLREPSLDDVFLALTGQPAADEPAAGSQPASPVRGAV